MDKRFIPIGLAIASTITQSVWGDPGLLKTHCSDCHNEEKKKGDFSLAQLGSSPKAETIELWTTSLDYVRSGEMPPEEESQLLSSDRERLIRYFQEGLQQLPPETNQAPQAKPRRLNNREFANSVRDVLMIEDVGTHQPTANLLGDSLQDGFDTDGDTLGLSQFHIEQYITSLRRILDATILTEERPSSRRYEIRTRDLQMTSLSQRQRRARNNRTRTSVDFHDIRLRLFFSNFKTVPASGRYRIKIRASGKDRGRYDSEETGIYDDDPIRLRVHLGDRIQDFHLPDDEIKEIILDEWLAKGTALQLSYPTDGLRLRGNGNFKFQYTIAHNHLKKHDPDRYARVLREVVPKAPARTRKSPAHWSHWVNEWEGPRPRVFNAEVEGPLYESWPPKRQRALLGPDPSIENAANILRPIAERAWRRTVSRSELRPMVELVETSAKALGTIDAFKEGIVAILVSPAFLMINTEEGSKEERFATKLSYFMSSTTPDQALRHAALRGELDSFESVKSEIRRQLQNQQAEAFLHEFPHAWLQLDRINFMAPDPDRFPLYDRKRLSDDMVDEVLHFFRHMIENNLPIPEFLSADYSFINADLARVYQIADIPQDSILRKHTFTNGRRGGLLGMGAFLTLTADSLSTSPIHRAVYVMENFLGIHPTPPPGDVNISEPDVRQAKTIKEILQAHTADASCASCHQGIDPYGYAFENFNPVGAWRDHYTLQIAKKPARKKLQAFLRQEQARELQGLPPLPRPWENKPIPVDAGAKFRNGVSYRNIIDYRNYLQSDVNRDRFVRCFITKLLTYANGSKPDKLIGIERILEKSAEAEYRIVDTIAAVVDSPLFRAESRQEQTLPKSH